MFGFLACLPDGLLILDLQLLPVSQRLFRHVVQCFICFALAPKVIHELSTWVTFTFIKVFNTISFLCMSLGLFFCTTLLSKHKLLSLRTVQRRSPERYIVMWRRGPTVDPDELKKYMKTSIIIIINDDTDHRRPQAKSTTVCQSSSERLQCKYDVLFNTSALKMVSGWEIPTFLM